MTKEQLQFSIFVVEDDAWYGEKLQYLLSMDPDYKVTLYESAELLLQNLDNKPDLITIDLNLPGIKGDQLFEKIRERIPDVPVIIISSQDQISVAVELLKIGVSDYLVKDDNMRNLLLNSIKRIRENLLLKREVANLKIEIGNRNKIESNLIGEANNLKPVFKLIEKASKSQINVTITGETGTGKEVVAQMIHQTGDRSAKKFVAINMAAIPSELVESELFGHEKGAFTGAMSRKIGKFEEANGGTIYLDEIAEMKLDIQSKLLRVLQERELVRLGGNGIIKLDTRIIVSTHKNLFDEVKNGTFREDLYYRIIGLPIELPPLRERGNDIMLLSYHFASLYAKQNKTSPFKFTKKAKSKLLGYHYPGNVRELKSIIDLALILSDDNEISAMDIVFSKSTNAQFLRVVKTLKEYNREIITYYLKLYNNSVPKVAEILDLGKSTIYTMIKDGEISI